MSENQVSQVIKNVIEIVAGYKITNLPSRAAVQKFINEANSISKALIFEEITKSIDLDANTGNVLMTDGTNKNGREMAAYLIRTSFQKTVTVGVNLLARGNAPSLLKGYNEAIDRVAEKGAGDKDKNSDLIKASVSASVSDQGPANKPFFDLMDSEKEIHLKRCYGDEWDNFTEIEKLNKITTINTFCKIHVILNAAKDANIVFEGGVQGFLPQC